MTDELKAIIFDIEHFAVHDGPGIRTCVFLKGCPLRCLWCHNPESWKPQPQLLYDATKCLNCGQCTTVCPTSAQQMADGVHTFDRSQCLACGACTDVCAAEALELCGQEMTVSQVFAEILKDLPFFRNSHGGLTLTGGEPMAHVPFILALLQQAKTHEPPLDTAMETSGFAPLHDYAQVLPLLDHVLFDIKCLIPEKHRRYTGVPLDSILSTLHFLDDHDAELTLRCPLIPGLNDSQNELSKIAQLANTLKHCVGIDLEPYHPLGISKSRRLGEAPPFTADFPPPGYTQHLLDVLQPLTALPVKRA